MIETELHSEGVVCTPWGDLDWASATTFRHVMSDLLQPGTDILIDLRHVDTIDAGGVSALVGFARRAHSIGCRASIRNATPELCGRLRRLGLQWILDSSIPNGNDAA